MERLEIGENRKIIKLSKKDYTTDVIIDNTNP